MDEIVTQYLPQAFAFIYTINSANAGGVQKDRVSTTVVGNQTLNFPIDIPCFGLLCILIRYKKTVLDLRTVPTN